MSDETVQERYDKSIKGRFRKARHRAKTRKLKWEITVEQYFEIITPNECHYCQSRLNEYGSGLDRIDNSKGYTIDNVLPCCGDCNKIRGDMLSVKEMLMVAQIIKLIRELFRSD